MDVAIVAPCPIPYMIGGAENLWRGLQDHINDNTPHQAEIIKLPSREHSFWELIDSYRRFAELDLTGFDVVISSKYPAWMVDHPRHACYMLHRLRGLYDTYHFLGMPDRHPTDAAPVAELRAYMAENAGRREALDGFFARVDGLEDAAGLPDDLFEFPGPFIRELVHFLDGIGLAPDRIARYGAISHRLTQRADYFPPGADVFVAHPPTGLPGLHGGRGSYLFTASRLDAGKRIALIIHAMRHVGDDVELRIAGSGPEEGRLRELAGDDARIRFLGRVGERELTDLYAGARAVAFVPYDEDYGYITLEAMLSGKPVVTCSDAGGATELLTDGETGLICAPEPEPIAQAINRLWGDRRLRRRMGAAARRRAATVTWDAAIAELLTPA